MAVWALAAGLAAGAANAAAQDKPPAPAPKPCSTEAYGQFDFWLGRWEVNWTAADGSTGVGGNTVVREFNGCVVQERYVDKTTPFAGTSLLVYSAGKWRQTWADNGGMPFTSVGGLEDSGKRMVLDLQTPQVPGMAFRIVFEDIQRDSLTWRFQRRAGADGAWTDQTVSKYRRLPAAG